MYYIPQKDDIGIFQNHRYVVSHNMVYMLMYGYVDSWACNTGCPTLAFYGTSHWGDRRYLQLDWTI